MEISHECQIFHDDGVEEDLFVGDACYEEEEGILGRKKGCKFGD